ncbi:MAG: peptidase [Symbiobacterium thermophilum]|uniref:Peptidase n=4 Tax=Symbiobacterium thermophilum TaxID=2734 RepID=A0A953I376_SYMTR|nr:zinc metallopeptidase [Symbiobacterium thermophilum]MBY6276166.1 peptidase [Symbiobacterium thermophilum]
MFDPTMIFLLPAIILVIWAQARVRSSFNEWSQVGTRSGVTAAQVARDILDRHGLTDVPVERVRGYLSDHYDPQKRVVRLSDSTYSSNSIAAIGVAAHEVGHAIQHELSYTPLQVRNLIWPVARIGDSLGPFLVIIGLIFGGYSGQMLMDIGILLFLGAVLFYLITLPVEFNASSRAVEILETGGYMTREEVAGARKVLNAAALTYVAGAATAIMSLVRLLFLRSMASDD